jgi:YggT family protein
MISTIIWVVFNVLIFVVIVDVVLSYFMSPYHAVRSTLDKIVNPLLTPIRKIVPPIMNLDFSPIILVVLLQVIESLLLRIV